ncbi:MAG: hypothetical protein DIZ80_08080 [endosymbiont of Galathealinum brachiosum]|uniref:DUF6531 domain-containing protein n=1 Tax=endosymbiont of Galathealinum brachiosum TaxID=2200906 RepID=A0A370DGR4_9GAMM|nr:MAG: hypothetical protein DIZ80_08080 [endosymbiont of Galathealinum brachiosum]
MTQNSIRSLILIGISLLTLITASFTVSADVDRRTGVFTLENSDFYGMERVYSSDNADSGLFGFGWVSVYDSRIDISDEYLNVFSATSRTFHNFMRNEDGEWEGKTGEIVETDNRYIWSYENKIFVFNNQGLVAEYISDDNRYLLEYDKNGFLTRFVSNEEDDYQVITDDSGRVQRFVNRDASDADDIDYTYNNGLLKSVTNGFSGVHYRYVDDGFLSRIEYSDDETMEISYQEFDGLLRVEKYIQGDSKESYKYEMISESEGVKSFSVDYTLSEGEDTLHYRVEYEDIYIDDEYAYTRHLKKYKQGELISEYRHMSRCSPISIMRYGRTTKFAYDEYDRIVYKESENSILEYIYNDINKLAYFQSTSKHGQESKKWIHFSYNENEDLVEAENSDGLHLLLQYDDRHHIVNMRTSETTIFFTYNDFHKPVRIEVEGKGALIVVYDQNGEIESVDTEGKGHSLALTITRTFQQMLSMLKPANIELSL